MEELRKLLRVTQLAKAEQRFEPKPVNSQAQSLPSQPEYSVRNSSWKMQTLLRHLINHIFQD